MGLNRKDGAGALLAASDSVSGLLGSVAALLSVRTGYEAAVAGALGSRRRRGRRDATPTPPSRRSATSRATTSAAPGCCSAAGPPTDAGWPGLPGHATYAVDVVECPDALRPALARLLFKVAVVDDLGGRAGAWSPSSPDVTAVTREGDLLGAHFASGGSSSQPSLIEIQAAVDEAADQLAEAVAAVRAARLRHVPARDRAARGPAARRRRAGQAARVRRDPGRRRRGARPVRLPGPRRPRRGRAARPRRSPRPRRPATRTSPASPSSRPAWPAAEDAPDEEPDTAERERLAEEARAARQGEMDARLRCAPPRSAPAPCTAAPTRCCAPPGPSARPGPGPPSAASGCSARAGPPRPSASRSPSCSSRLEVSIAPRRRGPHRRRAGPAGPRAGAARPSAPRLRDLGREHDELVNSVHRDEMARTQQRMRIEQLEERALEELGLDPDGLVADYGPDQLVPREPPARTRTATTPGAGAVRPRGAAEAAARGRAGADACSARSTRSRWRSSPRWRSGTSSSPSSSRTSRRPARTCSTSSGRSTSGSSRSSPRRTPT